jgi:hypothetical protein
MLAGKNRISTAMLLSGRLWRMTTAFPILWQGEVNFKHSEVTQAGSYSNQKLHRAFKLGPQAA